MNKKSLTGYSDKIGVAPGETIQFKVGTYGPERYRADIVRIICGDVEPGGAGVKEVEIDSPANGEYAGRNQPIHTGSCVIIAPSPHLNDLSSFSVQAMIWPTLPGGRAQAILGNWSQPDGRGFALIVDEKGAVALRLGDGKGGVATISTGSPLRARQWAFVAGSYDSASGEARIFQEPMALGTEVVAGSDPRLVTRKIDLKDVNLGGETFLMGAWNEKGSGGRRFGAHFNGKIDSPRLAKRALRRSEMEELRQWPPAADVRKSTVAAWDFSKDIASERVTDLSPNRLHGETVNLPARAMTGPNWDGSEQNWQHAPEQYGAIHFHDDDLYDAGWDTDFELTIPSDMRSGLYAARLRAGDSEDYIPFIVRPPRGKTTSKVAFLASTATYMAYANTRLHFEGSGVELMRGNLTVLTSDRLFLMEHPEVGLSLYDHHSDRSGVCYSSRLRPILDMAPKTRLWSLNGDTHVIDWLEQEGFDCDVITDEDLHREGVDLLARYRAVVTGAHPEYYSTEMLDAVRGYLQQGGRLMYMGGNGFYWRIAFNKEKPGVIEVRRAEDGTRAWKSDPGEYHHSFNGEYGGLWVRQRRAPNLLVGVGFTAQGFDVSSYYRRRPGSFDARAAFIFEGIGDEELIGDFGTTGGGAAGEEIDRYNRYLGSPLHTLVLASSENHSAHYVWVKEEMYSNVLATSGIESPRVHADMVFFECPAGGAVFSTGSIAWSASLSHNRYENNVSRITGNVLRRFLDEAPFELPAP